MIASAVKVSPAVLLNHRSGDGLGTTFDAVVASQCSGHIVSSCKVILKMSLVISSIDALCSIIIA